MKGNFCIFLFLSELKSNPSNERRMYSSVLIWSMILWIGISSFTTMSRYVRLFFNSFKSPQSHPYFFLANDLPIIAELIEANDFKAPGYQCSLSSPLKSSSNCAWGLKSKILRPAFLLHLTLSQCLFHQEIMLASAFVAISLFLRGPASLP